MIRWALVLAVATVGLFYWFVFAFMSDNHHGWTSGEPVQIVTVIGVLVGVAATLAVGGIAAGRAFRRRTD
jgi:hypothetical protein